MRVCVYINLMRERDEQKEMEVKNNSRNKRNKEKQ